MNQKFIIIGLILTSTVLTGPITTPVKDGCKTDKFVDEVKAGCQECETAYTRYYFNDGADKEYYRCAKCGTDCEACETKPKTNSKEHEGAKCTQCKTGKGPDVENNGGANCKPCGEAGCQTCSANFKTCETCTTPNVLTSEGTCTTCPAQHCQFCNSKGECVLCKEPKILDGVSCVSSCKTGDVKYNGRCVSCPKNCDLCNEVGKCQTCAAGYFLDSSNQCTGCPANCGTCYTNGKCKTCLNETTLQSDGSCGEDPWYKKWWVWLLIGLSALAILGALGYLISRRTTMKPLHTADTQQMMVNNSYSYVPRAGNVTGQPIMGNSYASGRGYY